MKLQQHGGKTRPPAWLRDELDGYRFFDVRLARRMQELAGQLWSHLGQSIPMACQDWANTKAAYRFLGNTQVREDVILEGHFQATRERLSAISGPVLILHDTTTFTFQRDNPQPIGITHKVYGGKDNDGRHKPRTLCGILMHSSLAVTPDGLPLGLAAVKFWSRKEFKGCTALKRKINPTRVPIETKESFRWLDNLRRATALSGMAERCVHIGDRESDIYELFCLAHQLSTHFLFRTCVDRLAGDGGHTVADEMEEVRVRGLHRIEVCDRHGSVSNAVLELRFKRIHLLPPIGKQANYPELTLTVLHATERDKPVGRDRIDWKLVTDLPVTSRTQAIEKLQWYATRWKIETFHKIMKSGCKVEQSKLRTSERLVNLIALYCILGWRIFWATMMQRTARAAPATLAFTRQELKLLDRLVQEPAKTSNDLAVYLRKLACLGGYLARAHDPPPGNIVIWRGLSRLIEIEFGYELALETVGN
ncbi:MAG: IS4 family transposase [Burkholderiaceae bacterium]|nr:IS4 family transposase [Burkholderiaceae bacterium]